MENENINIQIIKYVVDKYRENGDVADFKHFFDEVLDLTEMTENEKKEFLSEIANSGIITSSEVALLF